MDFPTLSQERGRQEDRERGVNIVLSDMQRFLPAGTGPTTLAAIRDYMVIRLGQFQTFDTLLLRIESIEILNRDATTRLSNLRSHALALLTDFSPGGPDREAFLQNYELGPESFQKIMRLNAALEARRVVFDVDIMILSNLNRSLEQDLEYHKNMLQKFCDEREQFRRIIQQKDKELEEERERAKRVVKRVEAERDRANRTANCRSPRLDDLELRLQEAERLYQASKRPVDRIVSTRTQQDHAAAAGEIPAPPEGDARLMWTNAKPRTSPQEEHGCSLRQDNAVGSESTCKFAETFERVTVENGNKAGNSCEDMTASQSPSGDSSVEKPVTTPKVIPCVPLLPPKPLRHAGAPRKP